MRDNFFKMLLKLMVAAVITLFYKDGHSQELCIPVNLKCEYLVNPIGIDAAHPRFSWNLQDARKGAKQSAYNIMVGTDSFAMVKGQANIWRSNQVKAAAGLITFQGNPLKPFTKYFWRVSIWDKNNITTTSKIANFETGMMEMKSWQGSWLSDNSSKEIKPAPYFRKVINLSKKIATARVYIAVAGLYELYINGNKIGNHRLDPMYTRFDRRTLYVTYDVTAQLQSGLNAIGVLLGNGWYNHQSTAVWNFHQAAWRARPAFCMDLRIVYSDGSTETIVTNDQWKTSLSPVIFNSIYTAEHYDARLEQPGWDTPQFTDSAWKQATLRPAPSNNIVAQALQPIRNVEQISTRQLTKINDTTYVFDLGRNIAGVSQVRVKGRAGTILHLKHAERLYKNGRVDMSNIDVHYRPTDSTDPFQTDIFILKGQGEETFMPRFNYKGFQYVEVTSNNPIELTKESLVGYFMHSDVEPVGRINAANATINKIWQATNNSYLSNLFGYPTDCPQREKNGWTGDAHIAIETGLYSFDAITIYEKWMADHRDAQQPNGVLPAIIPTSDWGFSWANGPDWTSTIAIVPWKIYLFYGDTKLLSDNYENIKRYVDHINELSPSGITSWGLGDWVPVKSVSPVDLTSSIYYFTDVNILAKAAKLFGKQADQMKYSALATKIKNAINAKYLNKETAIYGTGLQTEMAAPLYGGIVPEELKPKIAFNLAKRIKADSFHLDVGILGAKAILNALSENGYADVAYKIASQETFPSWGWWIVNNATTLYENWDINAKNDISLNHIMFGEIGAWLYKGIAGIKPDEAQPGFKNVLLHPNFVDGLDSFEARHSGPFGNIVSSWKKTGNAVIYTVTVPANSTASIYFPTSAGQKIYADGKSITEELNKANHPKPYEVTAGTYKFEIK